jgi:hypothetical protein
MGFLRCGLRSSLTALVLVTVIILGAPGTANAITATVGRSVDIPIKVVLIGVDQTLIDPSYLSWSGDSKNLPSSIVNVDLISGNTTGVVFHPKYDVSFAPNGFRQAFVTYLQSIEKQVNGTNPWFGQYQLDKENPDYVVSVPLAIPYVVYDANSVEDWLWNHAQDVGGYPQNGWTIILANLPELPSATWKDIQAFKGSNGAVLPKSKPHYYGVSHTDIDLGYRSRYRDFMNAWGGHHRMWFADVSAGPVFNSEWTDLPLQVVLGDNNIDLKTDFGKNWLTEYVGDYIWEATYNFVAPNFVYYPQYAPKYEIDVFVLDDRTQAEKQAVPIQNTVNKDAMLSAWQDLVPYSNVAVNLSIQDVPAPLQEVIKSSYKYTDSWIMGSQFGQPERYGVVDLRPVYKYVMDNFGALAPNARHAHGDAYGTFDRNIVHDTMTIPVFAFAFSNETYFTYTYKWFIGDTDWETGALLGIALPEAAFVSFNQWVFTRGDQVEPPQANKGQGFTQTIIHEVGHEFGLMHPHQYGDIGDFIYSPMGYFTDDYKFGQIDKDAIQRAHADELDIDAQNLLASSGSSDLVSQVRSKLAEADLVYSKMDYAGAVQTLLAAHQLAEQAAAQQGGTAQITSYTIVYLVAGIVVGLIAGIAIAMFLKRTQKSK